MTAALRNWFLGSDYYWRAFGIDTPVYVGTDSVVDAAFTAAVTGKTVTVDASTSTAVGATIVSYGWDFGDGTLGTGVTVTHLYAAAGIYTVTVTVTDSLNHSDTATQTVTVTVPSAAFTWAPTGSSAIAFDGSTSTDTYATITGWRWDFGDGTLGTGVTVTHAYATAGTRTVTLTVTDAAGVTDTATQQVSVALPPSNPTAAFTVAVSNQVATFDASASTTSNATITGYAWTFGDGATGTGVKPVHTYAVGSFTATLKVTDSQGHTATVAHPVTVAAPPNQPPTAAFTVTTTNLSAVFSAVTSTDGDGTIAGYAWTFGDGGTGTGVTPTHSYTTAGSYTVRLTVTDNLGAQGTTTKTVTVTAVKYTDYLVSTTATASSTLVPASTGAVLQQFIRSPDTGEFYSSQVHPETNGDESVRLSRMTVAGTDLDQMLLTGAGHGTTFALEYSGGKVYVWLCWQHTVLGGPVVDDLVRFPYKAGTYTRAQVTGLTVKVPGPGYRLPGFDWRGGYAVIRTSTQTTGTYRRFKLADVLAGNLSAPLNTVTLPEGGFGSGLPTVQGFATYAGALFRYVGAPSDNPDRATDPPSITEYDWATGGVVRVVDTSAFGGTAVKTEPEGLSVYDTGRSPVLFFGVTQGDPGAHTYPTWTLPLVVQQDRTSLVPGTYIPDAATTGLLPGWNESQLTVMTGTSGTLQLAAGQVIENALIKARVLRPTSGSATLRNCVITGELYPYTTKATASALVDCTATGTGTVLLEDCLLEARGLALSLYCNGVHGFNYTARRLRVRHTVDGFDVVNTHNSNGPVGVTIEGCMVGELAYYTPDVTHSDNHTHNDGVQIFGNSGLTIRGNRIEAILDTTVAQGSQAGNQLGGGKAIATGQAIAYTPTSGVITGSNVWGNYLDGGQQTITAIPTPKGGSAIGNIHDNKFGRNQITKTLNSGGSPLDGGSKKRPILIDPGDTATGIAPLTSGTSKVDTNGNVYADTGAAITDYVSTGA